MHKNGTSVKKVVQGTMGNVSISQMPEPAALARDLYK